MSFTYKIDNNTFKKIVEFAHARVKGSKEVYQERGESKQDKMIEDIIIGTLGEYGVMQYVKEERGEDCTQPDLKIYETKRKSFGADLVARGDLQVHVKSQGLKSVKRYGHSWLFQKSDKVTKEPKINDILALTAVDLENAEVEVLCYRPFIMLSNLYHECKVPYFRHTKHAVYLDKIRCMGPLGPWGLI